jgi:hypothetical protein
MDTINAPPYIIGLIIWMYSPSWTMLLLFTHMLTNNISTQITTINRDKFDKLITSLRTAVDSDGTLDKEATSYNDIFDAFRLALKFYHFEERIDKGIHPHHSFCICKFK